MGDLILILERIEAKLDQLLEQKKTRKKVTKEFHGKTHIESLYKTHYPRKIGITRALEIFKRQLWPDDELNALTKAILNYASHCKGKEKQYIMHFSTFATQWKEWIEYKESSINELDWESIRDGKDKR